MNAFFKNVIPAEAGIQRYLNVISYVFVFTGFPPTREQAWIPAARYLLPAFAGTSFARITFFLYPPARAQA